MNVSPIYEGIISIRECGGLRSQPEPARDACIVALIGKPNDRRQQELICEDQGDCDWNGPHASQYTIR